MLVGLLGEWLLNFLQQFNRSLDWDCLTGPISLCLDSFLCMCILCLLHVVCMFLPLLLRHCWLGSRKGIGPVKTEW